MKRNLKLAGASVLSLALLGGGAAIGFAIEDPKASREYVRLLSQYRSQAIDVHNLETDLADAQEKNEKLSSDLEAAKTREGDVKAAEAAVEQREAKASAAEAALKTREDAVKGPEAEKAASSIREGTWTVGRTVQPGTYTTEKAVAGRCYWGIYASGSNGDDIIANDIVTGGQPTVTLEPGQDFTTTRCGTWTKVG